MFPDFVNTNRKIKLAREISFSYNSNCTFNFLRMSTWIRSGIFMGMLLIGTLSIYHLAPVVLAQGNFGVDPSILPGNIASATGGETSFIALVRTILNYFLSFLGIIVLALVIYGGFMYVTAGVNEAGAETGKKILTYAVIGVLMILLSFVFVNTLLSAGSGGGRAQ